MPKGRGEGMPRRRDSEKQLRAEDGRVYSVSTILACETIGERRCRALIHRGGYVIFSGRAYDRMPAIKFNHCTSKFFGGRSTGPAPADVDAADPVLDLPRKPRRAVRVEEMPPPLADPLGMPALAPAVDADQQMAGTIPAQEESMTTTRRKMSERFPCLSHGQQLLECVREFEASGHAEADPASPGYSEAFAQLVNARPDMSIWQADATAWRRRVKFARYRFSPEGCQQAAQAARVDALRKQHKLKISDVWEVMGGWDATHQYSAQRPWRFGALERLADLFGVSVAYLRDGEGAVTPAAQAVLSVPDPPQDLRSDAPCERAERLSEDERAELVRLRAVVAQIERLTGGAHEVVHRDVLRMMVAYARGGDVLESMIGVLLTGETRRG